MKNNYSTFFMLAVGLAILGVTSSTFAAKMQNAVFNARIAALNYPAEASYPISQEAKESQINSRLKETRAVLDTSNRYQIPVSSNGLITVSKQLRSIAETSIAQKIPANQGTLQQTTSLFEQTLKKSAPGGEARKSAAAALVALVSYAGYNKVVLLSNLPAIQLPHGETGNSLVSQVPLNNGAAWWQGSSQGNTIIPLPYPSGEPVFPVSHSNVVFSDVNVLGLGGPGRAFVGADSTSQVLVMNATITGASQSLDSIVWLKVKFVNSEIIYNDSPLYLGDVIFENCRFTFRDDPESQKTLAQIQQAEGKPLTLVSGL